jgi:hypothetical protein
VGSLRVEKDPFARENCRGLGVASALELALGLEQSWFESRRVPGVGVGDHLEWLTGLLAGLLTGLLAGLLAGIVLEWLTGIEAGSPLFERELGIQRFWELGSRQHYSHFHFGQTTRT